MFGKLISSFAIVVSAVFSIGFPVPAQAQQQPGANGRELPLPKVKFPAGKDSVEIPFEVDGNWMVILVSVNGSRPLRFVLDTGASGTILYNSNAADSLNLKMTGTMQVRGAGGGNAQGAVPIAENVNFNIGGIEFSEGRLAVRKSPVGMPMPAGRDGVIGRIIFATLVVEVDWGKKALKFYEPSKYKYTGKGAVLPLTFDQGGRPYTTASVAVTDDKLIPVKLVVDTGGSHTLSLDVGSKPEIKLPEGATKTVLGRGASGEIRGYTGQVKKFQLAGYTIENVPAIFPDSDSGITGIGGRQGNLGAGVLRRFKIIYDYSRKQMIVEPNKFFSEPFAVSSKAAGTDLSFAELQNYVGRYGERTISAEDGVLFLQRQGGPKIKLITATKDEFTLERIPNARIKFVRDNSGKITELQVLNREGQWENSKKEQSKFETAPANQTDNRSSEKPLSQAEQEVRKLEREWLDAYEKRDLEAMKLILADDFKLIYSNGSVQTKADVLAQIKSAQESGRPSPKLKTEEVQSRVEGESVILTGRFIQQMERDGQIRTMQMRYTDTYIKRQRRWQIVASQLMRFD